MTVASQHDRLHAFQSLIGRLVTKGFLSFYEEIQLVVKEHPLGTALLCHHYTTIPAKMQASGNPFLPGAPKRVVYPVLAHTEPGVDSSTVTKRPRATPPPPLAPYPVLPLVRIGKPQAHRESRTFPVHIRLLLSPSVPVHGETAGVNR